MVAYAESSAVLAWLLGEPGAEATAATLAAAEHVVASVLTEVECRRALARARALERISETEQRAALQLLHEAARQWTLMAMDAAVLERAGRAFAYEPARTLDAIHLASAAAFREELGDVTLLSRDDRLRTNAAHLGLTLAD